MGHGMESRCVYAWHAKRCSRRRPIKFATSGAVLFAFAMALAGKLFYFVIERAAEPVSNILERQAASKSPIFRSA